MDTFDYLIELAGLVRRMRELQKVCFKSIPDAKLDEMMTVEGKVDDVIDRLYNGPLAPLPSDITEQLLNGEFLEEVRVTDTLMPRPPLWGDPKPDLPALPPPAREELFTESAEQLRDLLPDLPPPPARKLPGLDNLFPQWNPDEEKPK